MYYIDRVLQYVKMSKYVKMPKYVKICQNMSKFKIRIFTVDMSFLCHFCIFVIVDVNCCSIRGVVSG